MSNVKTQHGAIELDWLQDGKVSVLDKNRHRFLMTIQEAADACARGHEQLVFADELTKLMYYVHGWLTEHSDSVSAGYFAVTDRQLVFFVIPNGDEMDFALSDEIAQLELELFQDFSNVRAEVRQIPGHDHHALCTFLDLEKAILLHGKQLSASSPVGS